MTVILKGGLGNQLFMYALGRHLEERGREVYFHKVALVDPDDQPHHRTRCQYGLGGFRTKVKFAPPDPKAPVITDHGGKFSPEVLKMDYVTLDGHWQSEEYFMPIREQLLREITPLDNMELTSRSFTAVQVRRGDYGDEKLAKDYHGVLSDAYFRDAMLLTSVPHRIFSDDKSIDEGSGNRWHDLWSMSQARQIIISNSSFGWWGAWLGPLDRQVIAPAHWVNKADWDYSHTIPRRWIKIWAGNYFTT